MQPSPTTKPGAYNQAGWDHRKQYLGNTAEQVFEQYASENGISLERLGMDHESPLRYSQIDPAVSMRPDYLCQQGERTFFVEVKGTGNDGVVKIKQASIEAAAEWNRYHPVHFFVFDSSRSECAKISLDDLRKLIHRKRITTATFDDGNQYYPVPRELLTWRDFLPEKLAA